MKEYGILFLHVQKIVDLLLMVCVAVMVVIGAIMLELESVYQEMEYQNVIILVALS